MRYKAQGGNTNAIKVDQKPLARTTPASQISIISVEAKELSCTFIDFDLCVYVFSVYDSEVRDCSN